MYLAEKFLNSEKESYWMSYPIEGIPISSQSSLMAWLHLKKLSAELNLTIEGENESLQAEIAEVFYCFANCQCIGADLRLRSL